ncbi:MAG TPA: ABC transporter permease [Arachidicoccus sp.]
MNKILLIIQREFLSRVQKKTFLLVTIGLPILISGIYAAIIYFSVHSSSRTKIMVVDNANFFHDSLTSSDENISFVFAKNQIEDSLKSKTVHNEIDGFINILPNADLLKDSIEIIMQKKIGFVDKEKIKNDIQNRLQQLKINSLIADTSALAQAQHETKISFLNMNDKSGSDDKTTISSIVGFACGILIYMILLLYGMSVMRGVMEEKTNRIAEIVVSSVKPFQLMMGKILGIGAVGLLQFVIWIVLSIVLKVIVPMFFLKSNSGSAAAVHSVINTIGNIDFALIIPLFLIYFLGGYLVYASLFAAIGCTVSDGQQDAQGLQLPVTLPIIFGFVIMTQAINNPTSGLSVFGSLFPLTSPIVMMARVAQGVPDAVSYFQLILSILILFATFICTTWFAGKIYRTGILMYGKKTTWKELMKWAFRRS